MALRSPIRATSPLAAARMVPRLTLLFLSLLLPSCTAFIAQQMVRAPNLDNPASTRRDATSEELRESYIDRQLRIPVGSGPTAATLSVWVSEPTRDEADVSFAGKDAQLRTVIKRTPNPAAATQPARPIRGTLIFLHGIQDHKDFAPHLLYREVFVHEAYRVIQIDLRGHGRSTGNLITYGALESHDLVQALDALEHEHLITGKLGVIGFSYGSAIAIQWAAIDPRVKAIVAIEPFANLSEAAHDGAPFVLGPFRSLFSNQDISDAVTLAGKFASFDPQSVNPLQAITQTTAPVLLIHSRQDELIPFTHSQQLHDAAPDRTRLILVEKGSHFMIWYSSYNLIRSASVSFFNRYIAAPGTVSTAPAQTAPATQPSAPPFTKPSDGSGRTIPAPAS